MENSAKPKFAPDRGWFLNQLQPTIPVLILPVVHLIVCYWVDFTISDDEGGWKWFVMFFIDFPISVVLHQLRMDPFLAFTILGTLWWYLLGVAFRLIFRVGSSIANR